MKGKPIIISCAKGISHAEVGKIPGIASLYYFFCFNIHDGNFIQEFCFATKVEIVDKALIRYALLPCFERFFYASKGNLVS